jgi:ribose 5-phosphate isomerase A
VPIEVLPFATSFVIRKLSELGGKPRIRESVGKVGPVVTDNGNFMIDVDFGLIENPGKLDAELKRFPGVVETGLFVDMADIVYLGKSNSVKRLKRE